MRSQYADALFSPYSTSPFLLTPFFSCCLSSTTSFTRQKPARSAVLICSFISILKKIPPCLIYGLWNESARQQRLGPPLTLTALHLITFLYVYTTVSNIRNSYNSRCSHFCQRSRFVLFPIFVPLPGVYDLVPGCSSLDIGPR